MKKTKVFLESMLKAAGGQLEKFIFIFVVELAFLIIMALVGLLKLAGRFKEEELEPFPKNREKMIVAINHPDGNEWLFIYRRFFRPLYFLMPWLILKELPYTLAKRTNFKNPILRVVELALLFVDPGKGQESLRQGTIRKSIRVLENGTPLIGFFEGGRTRKRENFVYSKKSKALGELNESLGFIAKVNSSPVKSGWIELRNCSFYSLPENGRFNLRQFSLWYWLTLIGKNGSIVLLWGKTMRFDGVKNREEITRTVQDYLLELADKT